MNSLLNPYIAGAPVVEPSMFFGRHDVFQWIEHSLAGKYVNHILVIHGQRRVGKTSVLKQIPNYLPKSYTQVFFDLQGRTSTTLDRFLWWLAREISRVLKQEHGLAVPVPERDAFASDPEILLTQFLPALQPLLGERKLLLTFDEFDTLEQTEIRETLARPLIHYLRRMFELENLSFIFSIGSSGHKLENMQASYTDFFKTALYRKISFLGREDCFQLITRPVSEILEYEPKARQRIYEVTAGHPYFTQLVCHELFSLCQKTGKRSLFVEDVDGILDDVIERGTVNLKFTWDEASSLEKWILACLASPIERGFPSGSPLEGGRVLAALQEMLHQQRVRYSEPDLNAAQIHLRDKDILDEDNRFVVYLLQRWLSKNRPLDRVREELVEVNPIANRYIEIGEEYRSLGQGAKAIESFQQALAVDPLNLKAQVGIAYVHLEQKDALAAMHAFEQALGIDDEDVTARSGLCDTCLALGEAARQRQELEEASGYYRRILAVNLEHSEARQRLAEIYCQQGEAALAQQQEQANLATALAAYQQALSFTPEDNSINQRCTQLQALMREKAIAAQLDSSRSEASAGQWEAAIDRLQAGLQAYPGEPRLQEALAGVLAAQRAAKLASLRKKADRLAVAEKWAGALEVWQEYLSLEPQDTAQVQEEMQRLEAQRSLAEAYVQGQQALEAKDFSRAASLLKKVILVDENYKDGARLLAQAIEGKRQRKPAVRLPVIRLPKLHRRVWKPALLGLAGVLLVPALFFLGGKLASFIETQYFASLPTSVATSVATSAAMPTKAPTTAAIIPRIAYLIETLEPAFSDDFTTWNPVWGEPRPGVLDLWAEGGQMVLTPLEGESAIVASDAINAYHFALQYTLMFDIPTGLQDPDKYAVFSHSFRAYPETGGYELYVELNQAADNLYNWKLIGAPGELSGTTSLLHHSEANLITVAYLGDECVIWVNHQVLAHFFDQQHNGTINRLSAHTDQGTLKVGIDDLKFWVLEEAGQAGMPTPAPTQQAAPEWVVHFANPILESIAQAAPTFQDDFSYPRAEWQVQGGFGLEQGMGKLFAETDADQTTLSGSPLQAEAFVLRFFLRGEYPQGTEQDDSPDESYLELKLTIADNSWYLFYLSIDDQTQAATRLPWAVYQFPENIMLAQGQTDALASDIANQITVLFKDGSWGFYINDQPLGVVEGLPAISEGISIGAGTKGSPFWLLIDDVQFWDLKQLGSGAHAEGLPDFLQGRAPDFSDDFEMPRAEWRLYNGSSAWENDRMLMSTSEEGLARMGGEHLFARDFQLQYDFQVVAPGDNGAIVSLEFRNTSEAKFVFSISSQTDLATWSLSATDAAESTVELSSGALPGWDPLASHQLGLLAVGSQVWLALDGSLLTSLQDISLIQGEITLVVKSISGTASVAIDNFSLWNLDSAWVGDLPASLQPVILEYPPDFEDDFSTEMPEWEAERGTQEGLFEWTEGVLRVPDVPFTTGDGLLRASNYIFKTDLRFSETGENTHFMYALRLTETADGIGIEYIWNLNLETKEWSLTVNTDPTGDQYHELRNGVVDSLEAGQWASLAVVAYQDKLWIFWNGELEVYYPELELLGEVNHFILGTRLEDVYFEIDNLQFWELENAWMLDLPAAVQQVVLDTPPDFADDFSIEKPEWQVEPGYANGHFEWVDGVLRILEDATGDELITASDSIFRTNLRLNEITTTTEFMYAFRSTYTGEGIATEYLWVLNTYSGEWVLSVNTAASGDQYHELLRGQVNAMQADEWVNLRVVVFEDRLWIYWNWALEVYYQGLILSGENTHFVLGPESGNTYLELDNLKFWNLSGSR